VSPIGSVSGKSDTGTTFTQFIVAGRGDIAQTAISKTAPIPTAKPVLEARPSPPPRLDSSDSHASRAGKFHLPSMPKLNMPKLDLDSPSVGVSVKHLLRRRDSDASFGCAGTDDEELYVAPPAPVPKESYMKKYTHNPFSNRRPQPHPDSTLPTPTTAVPQRTSFESSGRPSSKQSNSSWATSNVTGPRTPTNAFHDPTQAPSLHPELREQEARINAYAKAKWGKEMENDSLFNFNMHDDTDYQSPTATTTNVNAGARSSREGFTGRTSPSAAAAYYDSIYTAPAPSPSSSNSISFYGPSSPSHQQQQHRAAQNLARAYQAEIGGERRSGEGSCRRPSFEQGGACTAGAEAMSLRLDRGRRVTGYGSEYLRGRGREGERESAASKTGTGWI